MKKTIFLFDCSEYSSAILSDEGVPIEILTEFKEIVHKTTIPYLRPNFQEEHNGVWENPCYIPAIISSDDANMFFFAHTAAQATSTRFYPYANNWRTIPDDREFFTAQLKNMPRSFIIAISHHKSNLGLKTSEKDHFVIKKKISKTKSKSVTNETS